MIEKWNQPNGYGRWLNLSKWEDFLIGVFLPALCIEYRKIVDKLLLHKCLKPSRKCDFCLRQGYPYFTKMKQLNDDAPLDSVLSVGNAFKLDTLWEQRKICVEDFDSLNDFLVKVVKNHCWLSLMKLSDCSENPHFKVEPSANNMARFRCESCLKTLAWF
jgi:hypothetical protein